MGSGRATFPKMMLVTRSVIDLKGRRYLAPRHPTFPKAEVIGRVLASALRTEIIASRAPQPMRSAAGASSTATYTCCGSAQAIDLNAIAARTGFDGIF